MLKNTLRSVCFLQQSSYRYVSAASANTQIKASDDTLKSFQDYYKQRQNGNVEDKSMKKGKKTFNFLNDTSDVENIQRQIRQLLNTIKTPQVLGHAKVTSGSDKSAQNDTQMQYPRHIKDLDNLEDKILCAGVEIDADHPGFKDIEYRKRREQLAQIAISYKHGQSIPRIKYTANELKAWAAVYEQLTNNTMPKYACKEYRQVFPLFQKNCGFRANDIPQLQDISDFLKESTGFTIRPTAGMLCSRDFLASLAFRVFRCTQYIRHHSKPMFTPEPDACHEILGHVPLLATPEYAQFSQEFGLLSLGASDELITKLASLYWYTIENGLCIENGKRKIYGAGLLSSPAEAEYCFSGKAKLRKFESDIVANEKYPLTDQNWQYFVVDSLEEAKKNLIEWASAARRIQLRYNPYTQSIEELGNPYNLKVFVNEMTRDLTKFNGILSRLQN